MTSAFAGLPAAVLRLAPEADACGPVEARATCARCPVAAVPAPWPWSFSPEVRCCTFTPTLPNFLAGRALLAGGASAEVVRRRLADPRGVSTRGIDRRDPSQPFSPTEFGRHTADHCPFWVGGAEACGIWADRPGVCRAWFCRHDDGLGAAVEWTALSLLVGEAEELVADALVALGAASGAAPPPPAATTTSEGEGSAEAFARWFAWCAEHAAVVEVTPNAELAGRRRDLDAVRARPRRGLSEHLVPSVRDVWRGLDADGAELVLLSGYARADAIAAPPAVFSLLALLDGELGWRDAVAACASPGVDAALVAELHRVGALRAADGADDLPFSVLIEDPVPRGRAPRD